MRSRFAQGIAACAITCAIEAPAIAADKPQITVRPSAIEVEAGESFSIEMKVLVDQGDPTPDRPVLTPPAGVRAEGPMISSQTFMQFGAGVRSVKVGIGAVWQLKVDKPGRYVVPSPTVSFRNKRFTGTPITVEVKPSSGRPKPQSPFLTPGGPGFNIPWPFGGNDPFAREQEEESAVVRELALPNAPDPVVFLRAVADKTDVVVGEQVIVTFYAYYRHALSVSEWHEAPLVDFYRVSLKDKSPEVATTAGGQRYNVKVFDRVALFPQRTGDLHTGSLRVTFAGRRVGAYGQRSSEDIILHVKEPPREGRPPGYALGDVGELALQGGVVPRKIDQGGTVAVMLKVSGTGNMPQSLRVPERLGVEWLDPEKRDELDISQGKVQGARSFGYVVRLKEAGNIDLGEVALPFWNPAEKRYDVARVALGMVEVRPTLPPADPSAKPNEPNAEEPFLGMPSTRYQLGAFTPPRAPRLVGAPLVAMIVAPPALVGLASAGAAIAKRMRARKKAGDESPGEQAKRALEAAGSADAKGKLAAAERAVHLAIEAASGLKSRGLRNHEVAPSLVERGVDEDLANEAQAILAACEAIRFEPVIGRGTGPASGPYAPTPRPSDERAQEIVDRAGALVEELVA